MINHIFISFSAVQIYEIWHTHLHSFFFSTKVQTEAMKYGLSMEPMVVKESKELAGPQVKVFKYGLWIHPDIDCMSCSPDHVIYDPIENPSFGILCTKSFCVFPSIILLKNLGYCTDWAPFTGKWNTDAMWVKLAMGTAHSRFYCNKQDYVSNKQNKSIKNTFTTLAT